MTGSPQVDWSATSPETGRYSGVFRTTPAADLLARFDELRRRGSGYCEVALDGRDYPMLSVSFQEPHAVVHLFFAEEHCALLGGDGTVASHDEVELSWGDGDGPATFTGEYVSAPDRAEAVLRGFVAGTDADALGDWYDL